MGHINNKVIIVNGDNECIKKAYHKAKKIFDSMRMDNALVSEIHEQLVNHGHSFCIFPDGAKLGWATEIDFRGRREEFKRYLKTKNKLYWIEVEFGGDNFDEVCIEDKFGVERLFNRLNKV